MEYRGNHSLYRSSVRSKGSSSNSDVDPREKVKDCCRKLVAFMCTQVGVGGLIVCYTIIGAFTFKHIEEVKVIPQDTIVEGVRNSCATSLWEVVSEISNVNKTHFYSGVNAVLKDFQHKLVQCHKDGYDGRKQEDVWSVPAALMFSLSIITMIGYGNMVPKTPWGKLVTVLYAIFGIPLYILYFLNMGEVLAGTFRWIYTKIHDCTTEHHEDDPPRRVLVPSSACLWVIGIYVLTGAIMFAEWEHWDYLNSTYFCITSLCKIGFGDLVPGANISDSKSGSQTKLVINFVYMLVGLGLVAMCSNLMREEVQVNVKELREDMGQCLEDTRMQVLTCCTKIGCVSKH